MVSAQELFTQTAARERIAATVTAHWKLLLVQGLLFEILGLLAFTMPFWSTLAVEITVGWLFFIGGITRVLALMRARHLPGYWWSLLAAILAMVAGVLLVMNPFRGMLTLTMLLTVLFLVEGFAAIFSALDFRHHARNWGWLLFGGLVNLLLVFLIWEGWPGTATWAIGMLTGINLFLIGLPLVMLSLAVRQKKSQV